MIQILSKNNYKVIGFLDIKECPNNFELSQLEFHNRYKSVSIEQLELFQTNSTYLNIFK